MAGPEYKNAVAGPIPEPLFIDSSKYRKYRTRAYRKYTPETDAMLYENPFFSRCSEIRLE